MNMSSRVWLLVEWVDESIVFPSYGIVNIDPLGYEESDLHNGNVIFIRLKHNNARRAKILRISDNKRSVKEHREMLERQDQKVKNVFQLCMETIKEMKSNNRYNVQQQTSSHLSASASQVQPCVVTANPENSDSDTDSERSYMDRSRIRHFNNATLQCPPQYSRKESIVNPIRISLSASHSRHRPLTSSTPLPNSVAQEIRTLYQDQGTQTDATLQPPIENLEDMEATVNNLYRKFQSLVSQVNASNVSIRSEYNVEVSYPNVSVAWTERNNTEYAEHVNDVAADVIIDNGEDEVNEENGVDQHMHSSLIEVEANSNVSRVRRMSAQTTNNIDTVSSNDGDLVPIGSGFAKVPARLLNDIDWNSYTSATRQLLQAVFPRRVLATHSLTGKQSPAFLNKPPKKILDAKLVEDIIKTVSVRCGVPKKLVRNCITIKCTDEAKLYRNRLLYKYARKPLQQNDENIQPSTPSSDESHDVN